MLKLRVKKLKFSEQTEIVSNTVNKTTDWFRNLVYAAGLIFLNEFNLQLQNSAKNIAVKSLRYQLQKAVQRPHLQVLAFKCFKKSESTIQKQKTK